MRQLREYNKLTWSTSTAVDSRQKSSHAWIMHGPCVAHPWTMHEWDVVDKNCFWERKDIMRDSRINHAWTTCDSIVVLFGIVFTNGSRTGEKSEPRVVHTWTMHDRSSFTRDHANHAWTMHDHPLFTRDHVNYAYYHDDFYTKSNLEKHNFHSESSS